MHQFVEDCGNDSLVVNLEVHAGVCGQTHQFLQDEASGALEDGIDHREDQTSVCLALMLIQQHSVLNVEVGLVVVEIDVFCEQEGANHVVIDLANEGKVGRV